MLEKSPLELPYGVNVSMDVKKPVVRALPRSEKNRHSCWVFHMELLGYRRSLNQTKPLLFSRINGYSSLLAAKPLFITIHRY